MDPQELAARLKAYALHQLEFDLVGITSAAPLEGGAHLQRWLAQGWHGEMAYMANTASLRSNPQALLPGARSVVCVAASYHDPPDPAQELEEPAVLVARYARRRDYHRVLKKRLLHLGRYLQQLVPQAAYRAVVDSAPLLEKELAQRAGLGWIGKNTCLINARLGSELLLGELLTTAELPCDLPARDHCGRCTACLQACPTQALRAPQQLDARRCIAYLTIEHRSPLQPQEEKWLRPYLFGCDLCQAVCPFNRHAQPHSAPFLAARPHLQRLRLPALQAMDESSFLRWAEGTPLRRLSYPQFRRNLQALASSFPTALASATPAPPSGTTPCPEGPLPALDNTPHEG